LLLCTARPEFHAHWLLRAHNTQITLNRLNARNVREMIAQVAARNALAADTVNTMIERTSGVPLFVEELTRAVLESGNAQLSGHEIPVTLHDSLMARLDRLGAAKEVLQTGAVIGGEFSYELLQAVQPNGDEQLQQALQALTDAELLYMRGIAPDAICQFKHALIRDAAYEALLKSRRKELHQKIAQTISENLPTLKRSEPEILARHWAEAGETEQAITEWTRAGRAAKALRELRIITFTFHPAVIGFGPDAGGREAFAEGACNAERSSGSLVGCAGDAGSRPRRSEGDAPVDGHVSADHLARHSGGARRAAAIRQRADSRAGGWT